MIADSTLSNIWHVQHENDKAEDEDVVTADEGHGDERTGEWSSHLPLAREANTPAME